MKKIKFTEREQTEYRQEFFKITSDQSGVLKKRKINFEQFKNAIKFTRIQDPDIIEIWQLSKSNNQNFKLQNFMAAMRLCSAKIQKKPLNSQTYQVQQKIIKRKKKQQQKRPQTFQKSQVKVLIPVLVNQGWFSSYYLYTIQTIYKGVKYSVQRRFSDLDWMHSILLKQFKGFNIPPRPQKKLIQNKTDLFIQQRRADMQRYLNILSDHYIISQSKAFLSFIKSPNSRFQQQKKQINQQSETYENLSLEQTLDKAIVSLQNNFKIIMHKKHRPFSQNMIRIQEELNTFFGPLKALVTSIGIWNQQISQSFSPFSYINFYPLNEMSSRYSKIASEATIQCQNINQIAKECLIRASGLKEAIASYVKTVDKIEEEKSLIERKYEKHRSSRDQETAAKYITQIQRAQRIMDKLDAELVSIETNVSTEFDSLVAFKEQQIERLVGAVVQQQKNQNESEMLYWIDAAQAACVTLKPGN